MNEMQEWIEFFIRHIPGMIGVRIRNRYYRKKFASCGNWVFIQSGVIFRGKENFFIGNDCNLSFDVFISASGKVKLGDRVLIAPGVKIYSDNHIFSDPDKPILEQGWEYKEVVIEDDVWIGADCFIKPGVTIGKGAVVSAGSVVSKSLPAYSISAGNPVRVVAWRKEQLGVGGVHSSSGG